MKERTNEENLELFADLVEPVGAILADKELTGMLAAGEKPVKIIGPAIKRHKPELIEILARIDGEDPATYKVNIVSLPFRILSLLNSPMVQELFTTQGQTTSAAFSGSAMENTEGGEN